MIFSNQASRPMEACARGAGRLAALVPALLEHLDELVESFVGARRGVRLRGDRGHARHDDARLAHARPRPRLPAVPARQGDRAVHERPGVPAAHRRRAAGAGERRAAAAPTLAALRTLVAADARATRAGSWPSLRSGDARAAVQTFIAHLLAPVADLGGPAVPARAHEAADPAQGRPAPRRRAPRGRRGHRRHRRLQPRRPPGRRRDRRRSRRCRASPRRSTGAIPMVLDSRRARRRRRVQGARARRDARSASAGRTPTGWRSRARPGVREVLQNFKADFDLTLGLSRAAGRSPRSGPENLASAAEPVTA